ncbi:unnamed protein product [Dovyalis caffra]|uniref:non-specific serine/threonine protein kinase n=1 Tax=Dovyalis caffra TaxID=77055 RepID=A0AAV1RVP5_9ROSI|nr:unnamed protein product [Dovyalis caffra]
MERSKKKAEKIELMENLPDDMIVEVLSRLPAKSIKVSLCLQVMSALICPHFIRLSKNRHNLFLLFEQHYTILDLYEATSDVVATNASMVRLSTAKVSDFGLAKLLGAGKSDVKTRVMGTFGYEAPEYANTGLLNEKSDVHSFGVVLLEAITGRDPVDYGCPTHEMDGAIIPEQLIVDHFGRDDHPEFKLEVMRSKSKIAAWL